MTKINSGRVMDGVYSCGRFRIVKQSCYRKWSIYDGDKRLKEFNTLGTAFNWCHITENELGDAERKLVDRVVITG